MNQLILIMHFVKVLFLVKVIVLFISFNKFFKKNKKISLVFFCYLKQKTDLTLEITVIVFYTHTSYVCFAYIFVC